MTDEKKNSKPRGLKVVEVLGFEKKTELALPLFLAPVAAGFPSPADDYIDRKLDLNEHLIDHPAATFFVRVSGDSMTGAGINSGDILIVDRAIEPVHGKIVVAIVDGELTVKRLHRKGGVLRLMPESPGFKPMDIAPETDFEVWGVVTFVIHKV
jgi:DNA polymerase V